MLKNGAFKTIFFYFFLLSTLDVLEIQSPSFNTTKLYESIYILRFLTGIRNHHLQEAFIYKVGNIMLVERRILRLTFFLAAIMPFITFLRTTEF